jgi:hypothetical protein
MCYFILESFSGATLILTHFSLQVPPEIKVTITKSGRSTRSQSFADYSSSNTSCRVSMELSAVCAIAVSAGNNHIFFLQLSVDERRDSVYSSHTDASSQFGEKILGR